VGQLFRPGHGGPLARRIEIGLAPGIEQIQSHVGLAEFACFFGVHVEAVGAAVDLRDARFHQRDELVVQPAVLKVALDAGEGGNSVRGNGVWVQSLSPVLPPLDGCM